MKKIVLWICATLYVWGGYEGIIKPLHEVQLSLPTDGVVGEIFVKEGSYVTKGAKILKLDDMLQGLEVSRRKKIFDDMAEIESTQNNLKIMKELYDSSKALYDKTASISQDELRNIEIQYITLVGKLSTLQSHKKQEAIEYEIAKEVLNRYILSSPINGVVVKVKPDLGEWAKSGEPLVSVVDVSTCYLDVNVDEHFAQRLRKAKTATIKVREGDNSVSKKGRVTFVSTVADSASALVRVKIEFDNKNGAVVPGLTGFVSE